MCVCVCVCVYAVFRSSAVLSIMFLNEMTRSQTSAAFDRAEEFSLLTVNSHSGPGFSPAGGGNELFFSAVWAYFSVSVPSDGTNRNNQSILIILFNYIPIKSIFNRFRAGHHQLYLATLPPPAGVTCQQYRFNPITSFTRSFSPGARAVNTAAR